MRRSVLALSLLIGCNPGSFDGLLGEQDAPDGGGDAGSRTGVTLDGSAGDASRMDGAVRDARSGEPRAADADVPPDDASAMLDASLDATVADAQADAEIDAHVEPACFAAGVSLISHLSFEGSPVDVQGDATTVGSGDQYGPGHDGSGLVAGEVAITESKLDAPAALTIAAWLRLGSTPTGLNAAWLWKGDDTGSDWSTGYWLVIAGGDFRQDNAQYLAGTPGPGHLGFALTDGSDEQFVLTDAPLPVMTWLHVAATYDGARMRLYLNGVVIRDEQQKVVPRQTSLPLRIASQLAGAGSALDGVLDELVLLDRALTVAELSDLYARGGRVCRQ